MAYGFYAETKSGIVQIDSTYEMRGFKITKSSINAGTLNPRVDTSITINSDEVLLVKPPGNGVLTATKSSNTYKFWGEVPHISGVNDNTIATRAVDYIILKPIHTNQTSYSESYGLQVLTPVGDIAFDSRAFSEDYGFSLIDVTTISSTGFTPGEGTSNSVDAYWELDTDYSLYLNANFMYNETTYSSPSYFYNFSGGYWNSGTNPVGPGVFYYSINQQTYEGQYAWERSQSWTQVIVGELFNVGT